MAAMDARLTLTPNSLILYFWHFLLRRIDDYGIRFSESEISNINKNGQFYENLNRI